MAQTYFRVLLLLQQSPCLVRLTGCSTQQPCKPVFNVSRWAGGAANSPFKKFPLTQTDNYKKEV